MAHFYDQDGNSCHEVMGANGKMKPTTIREARKLGLTPSVTTIMDVQSKPALLMWMQQQIIDTAIEFPFNPYEYDVGGYKKLIMAKTKARTEVAAKRGTELHDKLETYYTKGIIDKKDEAYLTPAIELIAKEFPGVEWEAEASFCSQEHGFGGRVDMYSPEGLVLDFKTKDKSSIKDMVQYDDHKIQLAAYQIGLQLPENTKRYNLFISTSADTPGLCHLVEAKELDKYRNTFYTLCELWRHKNNYDPRKGALK